MKYKVITDKQLNQLEPLLNAGWELFNVAESEKQIVYIMRRTK
jgi:hypothetical protein